MIDMAAPPKGTAPAAGGDDRLLNAFASFADEMKRSNLARKSEMQQTLDNAKKDIIATAFGPVLKMVEAISKMIALFILPFANLLMPLIMPLLYFLSPIVKFLNIQLRPLFLKMMEASKTLAQKMGKEGAAGDILSGAGSGLVSMISGYGDLIKEFFETVKPYISDFTDWLIKFLESIDIGKMLDSIWSLISGTMTKIWDAIAPSLEALWNKIDPWLKKHSVNLDDAVKFFKDMIKAGEYLFGPGPGGLLDAIVAQAKYFGQDVSKFIFDTLAAGLKLAKTIESGILGAVKGLIETVFNVLDVLDRDVFTNILRLIKDAVIPISLALFNLIASIDKDILLPFRKAASLLIPAILAMAAPNELKGAAYKNLEDSIAAADKMTPLIDQKTADSFAFNVGTILKNDLGAIINKVDERQAGRNTTETTILTGLTGIGTGIDELITTLETKAGELQKSIDEFLAVKDKDGNTVSKFMFENAASIDTIRNKLESWKKDGYDPMKGKELDEPTLKFLIEKISNDFKTRDKAGLPSMGLSEDITPLINAIDKFNQKPLEDTKSLEVTKANTKAVETFSGDLSSHYDYMYTGLDANTKSSEGLGPRLDDNKKYLQTLDDTTSTLRTSTDVSNSVMSSLDTQTNILGVETALNTAYIGVLNATSILLGTSINTNTNSIGTLNENVIKLCGKLDALSSSVTAAALRSSEPQKIGVSLVIKDPTGSTTTKDYQAFSSANMTYAIR